MKRKMLNRLMAASIAAVMTVGMTGCGGNAGEPAGGERGEGDPAELPVQAWTGGGSAGNTRGTVRGPGLRGRYPLTETLRCQRRENCW